MPEGRRVAPGRAIAAIVLAAGAGRRMGGPKALVEHEGRSFLDRVLDTCRRGGAPVLWTVCPPEPEDVIHLASRLGSWTATNPHPEHGMFSSVQVGIRALLESGERWAGVVVFPVDHPLVEAATVAALIDALPRAPEEAWLRPTFAGTGGHPVLIRGEDAERLVFLDPETPLRDALRSLDLGPWDVPVPDPHVLRNVNRPTDLG